MNADAGKLDRSNYFKPAFDALAVVYSQAVASPDVGDELLRKVIDAQRLVRRTLSDAEDHLLIVLPALEEKLKAASEERDEALRQNAVLRFRRRQAEVRAEAAENSDTESMRLVRLWLDRDKSTTCIDRRFLGPDTIFVLINTLREALIDIQSGGHESLDLINAAIDALTGAAPTMASSHYIADMLMDLNEHFRCEHSGEETKPYLREAAQILRGALK